MSIGPQPQLEPTQEAPRSYGVEWVFAGEHGLRAGWSLLLAYALFYFFRMVVGTISVSANLVGSENDYAPGRMFVLETVPLLAMLCAGALMAAIEQRRLLDYNLADARLLRHLALGAGAGIVALSALIGGLDAGGWLRFGAPALVGAQILRFAALWGCTYLLVACVEEGLFRCYLQFTLTRGLNFWWALTAETGLCAYAFVYVSGNGVYGVYAAAALGLFPCLLLHRRRAGGSAFWQAAWVSSTFFGMVHAFNGGENWTGILTAACMGFAFCVSLRVTGSVWWAIGCHAAWDWAETFVYGTADSGLPAQGHMLTTGPVGNPLLSGGADGPEGSVLAIAVVAVLGLALAIYGRRKAALARAAVTQSYPVPD
jgi:CAAX protease family protein